MGNMGQDCCAGSRLYVQASVYDKFVEKLVKQVQAFSDKVGDPFKEDTTGGPLASRSFSYLPLNI